MRSLGIPCVLDRVVMQAIAKVLGELFNPTFSDYSYGYRAARSVQHVSCRVCCFSEVADAMTPLAVYGLADHTYLQTNYTTCLVFV